MNLPCRKCFKAVPHLLHHLWCHPSQGLVFCEDWKKSPLRKLLTEKLGLKITNGTLWSLRVVGCKETGTHSCGWLIPAMDTAMKEDWLKVVLSSSKVVLFPWVPLFHSWFHTLQQSRKLWGLAWVHWHVPMPKKLFPIQYLTIWISLRQYHFCQIVRLQLQ